MDDFEDPSLDYGYDPAPADSEPSSVATAQNDQSGTAAMQQNAAAQNAQGTAAAPQQNVQNGSTNSLQQLLNATYALNSSGQNPFSLRDAGQINPDAAYLVNNAAQVGTGALFVPNFNLNVDPATSLTVGVAGASTLGLGLASSDGSANADSSATNSGNNQQNPPPSGKSIWDTIANKLNGVSSDEWMKFIDSGISGIENAKLKNRQLDIAQQSANDNTALTNLKAQQQANTSQAGAFNMGILARNMKG